MGVQEDDRLKLGRQNLKLLDMPIRRHKRLLPGFSLTLGYTLSYLSLLVLLPLVGLVLKTCKLSWHDFYATVTDRSVMASYKLTFGASLIATVINALFGLITAWVLVRYRFPGRRIFDALVDLPFALPTAVAGLTFAFLYSPDGWIGTLGQHVAPPVNAVARWVGHSSDLLAPDCLAFASTNVGVVIVLVFCGLPFVIRSVQPILQDLDADYEKAAASLGASRWTIVRRVIFPEILPAWLSGVGLAFARAVGEYGSVIFIASNKDGSGQIAPMQIIEKLENNSGEFPAYAQSTAIALVLLATSLLVLLFINGIEYFSRRSQRAAI